MGEVGREGRNIVGAPRELFGHTEEAFRQSREFARAVMGERPEGVAVAAADPFDAADKLVHRAGDGAGENHADEGGAGNHGQRRQDELAALLVEVIEDIAWRSGCVDHARNAIVDEYRHR